MKDRRGRPVFGTNWHGNSIGVREGQIWLARCAGESSPVYAVKLERVEGLTNKVAEVVGARLWAQYLTVRANLEERQPSDLMHR